VNTLTADGHSLDSSLSIAGYQPASVARPSSVAELAGIVQRSAHEGLAVYPIGGGTMLDLGFTPTKKGLAVDLRGLNQVIDYPARDMTITVQAGLTIAKLQEILAAENQELPVDIPLPVEATIGGAIAVNASGPRRFGFGTLRDYVIGITILNDRAEETKGGGRVVKNVAGYDLMKLYTGSLGTLGIITQVTLKVKPRTEASRWLTVEASGTQIPELLNLVRTTKTRPIAVVLNSAKSSPTSYEVVIGFEDNAQSVVWQAATFCKELGPIGITTIREHSEAEGKQRLAELRDYPLIKGALLTFKATMLPAQTWNFCQQIPPNFSWQALPGNGIVVAHTSNAALDQAREMIEQLGELARGQHGNLTIPRCPDEWKSKLPIWGKPSGDLELMKAIKDKLDPQRLFNPGRFVGQI
jgi:glycolate oxidase FAD binding subunit